MTHYKIITVSPIQEHPYQTRYILIHRCSQQIEVPESLPQYNQK
jgi:hypothetical protein